MWLDGLSCPLPCGRHTRLISTQSRDARVHDLTAGWGIWEPPPRSFVLLTLSLSFSSSGSLNLWIRPPACTHTINQEGFVSTGAFFFFLTSEVVPFFAVPREAASSHRSGAKSLNTYLREALSDTRRHKEKISNAGVLVSMAPLKSTVGRARTHMQGKQ